MLFEKMDQSERRNQMEKMVSLSPLTLRWICSICNDSTSRKDSAIVHVEAKHVQLLSYPCKYCDSNFKTTRQRRRHVYIKHDEV